MVNIKKYCNRHAIKYKENYNFGIKHGYKVDGIVSHYIETNDINKLCAFLYFASNNKLKVIGIGAGSNVLINNKIDAVFINYTSKKIYSNRNEKKDNYRIIRCDAGASKKDLINFCINNSLSGLEFLAGIPGLVSGGLAMNAGAYNQEISNTVLDIDFASPEGIKKYTKRELNWKYRNLEILPYHIISSASFITSFSDNKNLIKNQCDYYVNDRKKKHPLYFNSCGSVFKNPDNYFAWSLIKKSNLNLKHRNGAKISLLHSNFIINNGSNKTSSDDIINLVRDIKLAVYQKFNISLEEEIKIFS